MSGYKWLSFAVGVPLLAFLLAIGYRITAPMQEAAEGYSESAATAQGLAWYDQFITWLPLIVLLLLAFWVVVAIITRRRSVRV